ncbi:MAG TPA: recombinase family protein [Planctomycetaceae bacterium]|jgi:DNA invertase Pin-like site-specific DNA recombinase|nr:recombinase family protein [Planctomycetaceae bacterium]
MSARLKRRALTYLRRSSLRQELGIRNQLEWAIAEAAKLGVSLDAERDDVVHMEREGLKEFKSIFLDDGVTGANLQREAFTLFRETAIRDRSVSHLFIYKSDRFARPEQANEACSLEIELLLAGITIVFHNRVANPRERGVRYIAEDVQQLFEYHQSGQFLPDHAERILRARAHLARQGYWTGGPAPYGCGRMLVDAEGNKIQELEDGMTVRREGCHVRIFLKDLVKIQVWLQILDWYANHGWGVKKIARRLNELGVPSSRAGKVAVIRGVKQLIPGRWDHRQVARLIENRAIIGELEFGKKLTGAHRRLSPTGPRLLTDAERDAIGRPINMKSDPADRIVAPSGYKAKASRELFDACQEQRRQRGASQRGIRKSEAADYPLSMRIFDGSEGCDSLMYGTLEKGRRRYVCSKYSESKCRQCHHHYVDANAALRFALAVLRQRVLQLGGRAELRNRLTKLANTEVGSPVSNRERELELAEQRLQNLEQDLTIIGRNLARADDLYPVVKAEYESVTREIDQQHQRIGTLKAQVGAEQDRRNPEDQVEQALALLDQLERIAANPEGRAEASALLTKLDFLIAFRFGANRPKSRPSRIPVGGMITIGDPESPIRVRYLDGVRSRVATGVAEGEIPTGPQLSSVRSESRRHEAGLGKGTHH